MKLRLKTVLERDSVAIVGTGLVLGLSVETLSVIWKERIGCFIITYFDYRNASHKRPGAYLIF